VGADFVANQTVVDAVLHHVHDIAVRDGACLASTQVLFIGHLALGVVALLFFILGIADQPAGRQPRESANSSPGSGAAQLFAHDSAQSRPTGGPDDRPFLRVVHVRATQACTQDERSREETFDNPLFTRHGKNSLDQTDQREINEVIPSLRRPSPLVISAFGEGNREYSTGFGGMGAPSQPDIT
jgi:hypothetical protein